MWMVDSVFVVAYVELYVWWSIMGSYCICRVICLVVYNGKLLHM